MMPSTLELSDNDTRESALWKVGEWFDGIADEHAVTFVAAISRADMQPYELWRWIEHARLSAAEERARFLEHVGKVLGRYLDASRTP